MTVLRDPTSNQRSGRALPDAHPAMRFRADSGSGDVELLDCISWAPAATATATATFAFSSSFATEELLSCSDVAGGGCPPSNPQSRNASFAFSLPIEDAPEAKGPEPTTGAVFLSGGGRLPVQTEWDLRLFHRRPTYIVSVRHRWLLRCLPDGSVTTTADCEDGVEWVACATGNGASRFECPAHRLFLTCDESGALRAVRDPATALEWLSEDAGSGNLFLRAGGRVLQCTPEGNLTTSPNRRSWEIWRPLLCDDHENVRRDLARDPEPLLAVAPVLPLLRSYFHAFPFASQTSHPMPTLKAMTLALGYFLTHTCGWRVTLPTEVLTELTGYRASPRPTLQDQPEPRLSVLNWLETILAFTVSPGGPVYILDLDFKHKFDVLRKTRSYADTFAAIPNVFLGSPVALAKEVARLTEALARNFKDLGMALPWWRALTSILSLYDTCAMGDPGTTYECLGALTPLLLTPPAPADPHDGLHHLTWTLREFLTREADTVSSPAGALNANHREAARRSAPSPMEEELDFSKEDSGSVAAGDGDCPGAPGLLSELFRPRGWGAPKALLTRTLDHVAFHHVLRHVAAHADLSDMPLSPPA